MAHSIRTLDHTSYNLVTTSFEAAPGSFDSVQQPQSDSSLAHDGGVGVESFSDYARRVGGSVTAHTEVNGSRYNVIKLGGHTETTSPNQGMMAESSELALGGLGFKQSE